jgi:hypothetical protein
MKIILLGFIFLLPSFLAGSSLPTFASTANLAESPSADARLDPSGLLNPRVPNQYRVVEGDTLWDISALFLRDPWMWPEIWHANQQIANPHLIFPGDIISLVYIHGVPKLVVSRNRDQKLSPQIRVQDHREPISALPLKIIQAFLSNNRVASMEELNAAPYVLGGYERRLLVGVGDDFYARGDFSANGRYFGVYRPGKPYQDPSTGEVLGIRAKSVGTAKLKALKDDIATLGATYAEGEIRRQDRLLSQQGPLLPGTYYPRAPEREVTGTILSVEGALRNAGALDVVALNLGEHHGLHLGDTLAIFKMGELVKDPIKGKPVRLPDEPVGLLMVFHRYQKMSFALVLEADRQLDIGDLVRNP